MIDRSPVEALGTSPAIQAELHAAEPEWLGQAMDHGMYPSLGRGATPLAVFTLLAKGEQSGVAPEDVASRALCAEWLGRAAQALLGPDARVVFGDAGGDIDG